MQHQEHYGRKFYIDHTTGYWISVDYPRIRAHVWVWQNNFGEVKKGYHIHHVDENKSNNEIDNLQEISAKDHALLHMTDERRKISSEWASIIRPLTKEWHASEEGNKWHSEHAKKTFKRDHPIDYLCECCGSRFIVDVLDVKRTKFCSNKCKSKFRRDSGKDDIAIKCEWCGEEFKRNKYAKQRFCSKKCSGYWQKNKVDKASG